MALTGLQILDSIERYQRGESSPAIAEALGVSATTVLRALQRSGIPRRTRSDARRVYTLNEAVFDSITADSAYWIGFLMADGCVYVHQQHFPAIQLELARRDHAHVEKFRDFLGASNPFSYSSGCIRLFNQDIIDLYDRVPVGAHVTVIQA